MKCRYCKADLRLVFVDLGSAPPSNAYFSRERLMEPEIWYPLRVLVCTKCWLVQTEDFASREELFSDEYAYFSSYSLTWQVHVKKYVEDMIERFQLNKDSFVVEIASNDGCLLSYVKQLQIPCLGIEPTRSTASAARQRGLEVIESFFGLELAQELVSDRREADLIVANNVLAHAPDISNFVRGFSILLKANGVATFEFPHIMQLVAHNQFDTIYHEHYSYLSLTAVKEIFDNANLRVFDVEELSTHGGSLRVYACRKDSLHHNSESKRVKELLAAEQKAGITTESYYYAFQQKVNDLKDDFLTFLISSKKNGRRIAAYGAAAKGNTLLNYAGIRPDLIPFVVDRNPAKQGKFLPGSRIPVVSEDLLHKEKPDYVIVLPWNIKEEIMNQLSYIRDWGGKFVTVVPELRNW